MLEFIILYLSFPPLILALGTTVWIRPQGSGTPFTETDRFGQRGRYYDPLLSGEGSIPTGRLLNPYGLTRVVMTDRIRKWIRHVYLARTPTLILVIILSELERGVFPMSISLSDICTYNVL